MLTIVTLNTVFEIASNDNWTLEALLDTRDIPLLKSLYSSLKNGELKILKTLQKLNAGGHWAYSVSYTTEESYQGTCIITKYYNWTIEIWIGTVNGIVKYKTKRIAN